jgi:hypothetical protein
VKIRLTSPLLIVLASVLVSPASWAQTDVDTTLDEARQVAREGLTAFDQGRYEEALDKLSRAYAVVRVPTLALYTARAFAKLGKLVEASERYVEAMRLEEQGSDAARQSQARADAATELRALLPRMAKLSVSIEGADPTEIEVTVDRQPLSPTLYGVAQPANPGKHRVEGSRGGRLIAEEVTLAEGQLLALVLHFANAPQAQTPSGADGMTGPVPAAPAPVDQGSRTSEDARATRRTLGWVGIGVGTAGLVVGGVAGVLVLSRRSSLDDHGCSDGHCYADQSNRVDAYNQARTVSTIGFAVGGVGLAGGLVLLLTGLPKDESKRARTYAPAMSPWIGVGSVGMHGRF